MSTSTSFLRTAFLWAVIDLGITQGLAQTPGGVSSPAFWIKADAGFSSTTWTDQSSTGSDLTLESGTMNNTTTLQNYNPMVTYVTDANMQNTTTQVGTGTTVSAFFVGISSNTAAAFVIGPADPDFTTFSLGPIRFNRNHFVTYGNTQTLYPSGPNNTSPAPVKSILSTQSPGGSGTYYNNGTSLTLPAGNLPGSSNAGSYPYIYGPAGSLMGEGIIFNRILTTTERQQVQSYLAVKYGAELAENYLNTSGTTVYNVGTYPNDVIGIAQDAAAGLLQKQSHTPDDSLKIYMSTLAATNAANTGTFPVTAGSKYVLIGHNGAAQNGRSFSTEYPAAYVDPTSGTGIYNRISREWKITNTNYSSSYSLQLQLDAAAGPLNVNDLRLLVDTDGNFSNATVVNSSTSNRPTLSVSGTLVTISNISSLFIAANTTRYITLASIGSATPLPVTLLKFEAKPMPATQSVTLHWTTSTEKENSHFVIERSADATTFEAIGMLPGQGTTTNLSSYSFTDNTPHAGINYYRLKQVNQNGTFHYSAIEAATMGEAASELVGYPNPVSDRLYVSFAHRKAGISLELYNASGKRMDEFILSDTQNFIDMTSYPPGLYYLKNSSATVKILKK